MKTGDLVQIWAPLEVAAGSYRGRHALFLKKMAAWWCSVLIDGQVVTVNKIYLRVVDVKD